MKAFRIILLVILSILCAYSLYATIGYIVWGGEMPKIYGTPNTTFMGMYLMAITFGVVFIICAIIIVILSIRLYRIKKK